VLYCGLVLVALVVMMAPTLGAPLIERHAWRQCDTASFARGLARGEFDVLHPRFLAYYPDAYGIDGATESEFNLYPLIVSWLYRLFGVQEWIARAVSLLFSLATGIWVFLLAKRVYDETAGLLAGLMLALSPLFLFYGRSVQPDAAALSLSVGALYAMVRWLDDGGWGWFLASVLMMALGLLTKVTALYMGLALAAALWNKRRWQALRDWRVWLYGVGVLAPMLLYYAYARSLFSQSGLTVYGLVGGWPGSGKFGNWEQLTSLDFYRTMFVRLRSVILSRYVLALAALGLAIRPRREEWPLYGWLLGMGLFILFAAQGNRQHEYYQLPLVPICCLFGGKAASALLAPEALKVDLAFIGKRLGAVIVALALILSVRGAKAGLDERLRQTDVLLDVALATAEHTPAGAPVAIIHDWARVPEVFYYADRRGWSLWIERDAEGRYGRLIISERVLGVDGWQVVERLEQDAERIALLRAQGAERLVVSLEKGDRAAFDAGPIGTELAEMYALVAADDHWLVYDLTSHLQH